MIHATAHHPVWDATAGTFTYAADLHPGDRLREPTGATAEIARVRRYTAGLTAYNLDVTGIHTYYVQAGRTAILVHNSCGSTAAEDAGSGAARTLFHYTDEAGQKGIVDSGQLNPSLREVNPADARYGNGQYLSDIKPGSMTSNQLSRAFLGAPFWGSRFTNFVEIDVSGLNVVEGRAGVFVIPNEGPLDLTGRIASWGAN